MLVHGVLLAHWRVVAAMLVEVVFLLYLVGLGKLSEVGKSTLCAVHDKALVRHVEVDLRHLTLAVGDVDTGNTLRVGRDLAVNLESTVRFREEVLDGLLGCFLT